MLCTCERPGINQHCIKLFILSFIHYGKTGGQANAPEGAAGFCSRNIFAIEFEYTLFKFSISLFQVNPSHLHFWIYKGYFIS